MKHMKTMTLPAKAHHGGGSHVVPECDTIINEGDTHIHEAGGLTLDFFLKLGLKG